MVRVLNSCIVEINMGKEKGLLVYARFEMARLK